MVRLSAGIKQTGGKSRSLNRLKEFTPHHEFFLSLFSGACWFELNKPRCRYECFNDFNSEIINYLLVIKNHPDEFDEFKKGVMGLISHEIYKRIMNGEFIPKNNIERAYLFYYINKLSFGATGSTYRGMNPPSIKPGYKGISYHNPHKIIEKIKEKSSTYRGITLPTVCKVVNIEKMKKEKYRGLNSNTTRPWTNNDNGLMTPINPECIKRLRYVNLTAYDFKKVYKLFHRAFYIKKGLTKECFIYEDPPYPGTEEYYNSSFGMEEHQDLININLESPFNIMQSIGGECDFYIDSYKDAGWVIKPIKVKYSTDANSQKESQEYVCMNYDIKKEALMKYESSQKTII